MKTYPLLALSRLRMQTDGAGVTTLVAGAGCPLRCKWCINKKLLAMGKPERVTPRQLYEKVRCDDLYFRATGGGVTFGGGEPLLHAAFLSEFRELCPQWKLYVETSLNVPKELLEICCDAVDGFIVDIKDWNEEVYRAYTGESGLQARENLRSVLDRVGAERVMVRVPLIPGFNTPESRRETLLALKGLGVKKTDCFSYVVREPD